MRKLRILLASETYPPDVNGAAIFTQRLAQELANRGHEVAVVAPGVKFKDEVEKSAGVAIFRIKSIPLKPIHPYFRVVHKFNINAKIGGIIRDFKPEIIHIQNHFTLGKACLREAKKFGLPIIGTDHFLPDNLLEYFPRLLEKNVSSLMWKDFLKIYNQLDRVTVPSRTAEKIIKGLGLKNNILVISNGIDLEKFKKISARDGALSKFNISKNLPIFIFVGRLEKDKNVDLIIESAGIMLKKISAQVVIVGKGKDENRFKNLAKKLHLEKDVIFTGRVEDNDLRMLLSSASVYVASGSAELQGIAVMEAMAGSLPVLAVNRMALTELVKDGVNGFLFELDKSDLSRKMLEILKDKKRLKNMGENSLRLIQGHDINKTITKFEQLYEKTIS